MKKLISKLRLPKGLSAWKTSARNNPSLFVLGGGIVLLLTIWGVSSLTEEHPSSKTPSQNHKHPSMPDAPKMVTVSSQIDPRDTWTRDVQETVKSFQSEILALMKEERESTQQEIAAIRQEAKSLREEAAQLHQEKEASQTVRIIEPSPSLEEAPRPSPTLGYLKNESLISSKKSKTPAKYVASGSFARAVLLTGVVAETGTDAQSAPQPILLRLVDHGIFSKGYKTKAIKDAIIIGSCYGVLSSERALCRLESVSLTDEKDAIIERSLEGWLIGEDGRPGLKGDVVDKASDVARMAILNGILGGIAGFFQNQAQASTFPVSPISGAAHALKGTDALKAGASSGVGSALTKLADYAIKRAEQMNPVILIGAGRQVDVVFRRGFHIEDASPVEGLKEKVRSDTSLTLEEQKALAKSGISGAQNFVKQNNPLGGM